MRLILLLVINLYQNFLSPLIKNLVGIKSSCRFYPTCSDYTKNSIAKFGVVKGGQLSIARLFKCQPWI